MQYYPGGTVLSRQSERKIKTNNMHQDPAPVASIYQQRKHGNFNQDIIDIHEAQQAPHGAEGLGAAGGFVVHGSHQHPLPRHPYAAPRQ
jgi:hypothetical protein